MEVREVDLKTEAEVSSTLSLDTCHGSGGPLDFEAGRLFLQDGTSVALLGALDVELDKLVRLSKKECCERRGLLEKLDQEISTSQVVMQ